MKYILFAGQTYYPNGGVDDFKCFDTLEECIKEGERLISLSWEEVYETGDDRMGWYNIADQNMQKVAENWRKD